MDRDPPPGMKMDILRVSTRADTDRGYCRVTNRTYSRIWMPFKDHQWSLPVWEARRRDVALTGIPTLVRFASSFLLDVEVSDGRSLPILCRPRCAQKERCGLPDHPR